MIVVGALLLLLVGAGVAASLVVLASLKKTKWGINVAAMQCPRCGAAAPGVRKPANARQALWGGWTCAQCGAEMDKWGRLV